MMRKAVKERETLETAVSVSIGLDGSGKADIATGESTGRPAGRLSPYG